MLDKYIVSEWLFQSVVVCWITPHTSWALPKVRSAASSFFLVISSVRNGAAWFSTIRHSDLLLVWPVFSHPRPTDEQSYAHFGPLKNIMWNPDSLEEVRSAVGEHYVVLQNQASLLPTFGTQLVKVDLILEYCPATPALECRFTSGHVISQNNASRNYRQNGPIIWSKCMCRRCWKMPKPVGSWRWRDRWAMKQSETDVSRAIATLAHLFMSKDRVRRSLSCYSR
ncbi:uncharacterized protein YALI1_D04512g [Yarrowia lipolytica]|uniref:Uncharacterized protein n=1 Tax=Yarrowia lipolytica TaxID=4952 RepID=A0A1D8ND32_YARLL|nr:hypothetical protein YALI1_D04512g [Yarrowia lipolytica]